MARRRNSSPPREPAKQAVAPVPRGEWSRWLTWALFVVAIVTIAGTRSLPMYSAAQAARDDLRYEAANGKTYPYLIGQDSLSWVRKARNLFRTGTVCDRQVGNDCRDDLRHAPVGSSMPYAHSWHIKAIAWLHRVMALWDPLRPIETSAFWLQVVVGTLGVIPAWAIGYRLAGPWAAFFAAVLTGMNRNFFERSLGADNDVWNVVLPVFSLWALLEALMADEQKRRLAWTLLAASMSFLLSTIWSGWVLSFICLVAGLLLCFVHQALALRIVEHRHDTLPRLREIGLVTAGFTLSTMVTAYLREGWGAFKPGGTSLTSVFSTLTSPVANLNLQPEFPDGLHYVSELHIFSVQNVLQHLGGRILCVGAVMGVLFLMASNRRWSRLEGSILLTTAVGLSLALQQSPISPALATLLTIPSFLVLAGMNSRQSYPRLERSTQAAWLLAAMLGPALYMSLNGQRYLLLAMAPLGLAFGLGVGRILAQIRAFTANPILAATTVGLATVAVSTVAGPGFTYASRAVPLLNHAWADTLEDLRRQSPSDSIVDSWWPYGYWVEYLAERAVALDGASVKIRASHWLGRALLASDEQVSLGFLRLLACASDGSPEPEGRYSAFERIAADTDNRFTAYNLLERLAGMDRASAEDSLARRGISETRRNEILDATHCRPRPVYLVLSDQQLEQPDLRYQGGWSPIRAVTANHLRRGPKEKAVQWMTAHLELDEDAAGKLYEQAAALTSAVEVENFIAPNSPFLTRWLSCREGNAGEWICPVQRHIDSAVTVLQFRYPSASPRDGRLEFRVNDRTIESPPELLVVGDGQDVQRFESSAATGASYAVAVDLEGRRIRLGPPYLLRSTLSRLLLFDRSTPGRFELTSDHRSGTERVRAWRVHFP